MFFLKTPIFKLLTIFIFSGIILTCYSFYDKKVVLFGQEIKKTEIKQFLENQCADSSCMSDTVKNTPIFDAIQNKGPVPGISHEKDTTQQRILLIGDSMIEGLMSPFLNYCDKNGHKLFPVIWYSSSTLVFGKSDTLSFFVKKVRPTLIVISLGSNEQFINHVEKRNVFIANILKQADTIKVIWIGPPSWRKDTGIDDLICSTVGSDRYFPSQHLKFQRCQDGAHPTRSSACLWMDSIAQWIMLRSRYHINLKKPETPSHKTPNVTILKPPQ